MTVAVSYVFLISWLHLWALIMRLTVNEEAIFVLGTCQSGAPERPEIAIWLRFRQAFSRSNRCVQSVKQLLNDNDICAYHRLGATRGDLEPTLCASPAF